MAVRRRALIRTDPEQIASIFPATASRILLPGVEPISYVMPPEVGWEGFGFRIADVVPADPIPEGKQEAGRTVELVDGVPVEVLTLEDAPPAALADVSAAQAKLALDAAGLLDDVEAMIEDHPVRAVRIWYADANVWVRSHPYIAALGLEMDLDDQAIDALFEAATLY